MANVLLYPERNGTGQGDQTKPSLWPEHLVPKMLVNGWSTVPNVKNPKVAQTLIEAAQNEVKKTLTGVSEREVQLAQERQQFLRDKAEFEALKNVNQEISSNTMEQTVKRGSPFKNTEV